MANFGHYFGSTLGSTLDKLNQVAGEVSGTVHNVAFTLEQTLRDNLRTPAGHHPHDPSSGPPEVQATSTPHSNASSPASTPDSEGGLAQAQAPHEQCDPRTHDEMACDHCGFRFNLFQRKKQCPECLNYFCGNCLSPRRNTLPRTCAQCRVLSSQPPIRSDLMKLRVKDLRRYLNAKQVNTKSCVEKKDLVELIIRENSPNLTHRSPSDHGLGYRSNETNARTFFERQTSFPKSYTEGSHRPHWMSEDTPEPEEDGGGEGESSSDLVEDFVVIPSPSEERGSSFRKQSEVNDTDSQEDMQVDEPKEQVHPVPAQPKVKPKVEPEVKPEATITVPGDTSGESSLEEPASHSIHVNESSEPQSTPPLEGSREPVPSSPHQPEGAEALLKPNVIESVSNSSTPSSPRRFANRGLVYLSEIQSLDDLQELSVKQIKDILAMNRVTFKGVLEKNELLNILTRLWKQEQQLKSGKEAMVDDDLCKICMDDPVDCVMLECGHMCTCTQCGKQMAECPMCRQYVVRVVRTFKS